MAQGMTVKNDRIRELIEEKGKAETDIDQICAEDEAEQKEQEEREKAAKAAGIYGSYAALSGLSNMGGSLVRTQRIESLRRRIARINDELTVNLLDAQNDSSERLEKLTAELDSSVKALGRGVQTLNESARSELEASRTPVTSSQT